jgi:hypothetical protein
VATPALFRIAIPENCRTVMLAVVGIKGREKRLRNQSNSTPRARLNDNNENE